MNKSIQYPALCLNIKASEDSMFAHVLEKDKIATADFEWFQKYLIGAKFCDANGQVWRLKKMVRLRRSWNILPIITKPFKQEIIYRFEFEDTLRTMSLDTFKTQCKEISKHMFNEGVWEETFTDIDSAETYETAMDNFRIRW